MPYLVFPRIRTRVSVFAVPSAILIYAVEGAFPFAILILSALLHEAGHLAAMRIVGARPRRVDILPLGALIVCPEGMPDRDELTVALAGPLASLSAFAVFCPLYLVFGGAHLLFAAAVNLALGTFNLIPCKKLDGGKALYCLLTGKTEQKKAYAVCSAVSYICAALFAVICALAFIASGCNVGLMIVSVSLLLQMI